MNDLRVIHEAESFIVIDKPSGLLSVPGKGEHKQDCVVARAWAMFSRAREAFDAEYQRARRTSRAGHEPAPPGPGHLIVHRLDMDTSGLMVVALSPAAQKDLSRQFEHRIPEKSYLALLHGHCPFDSGEVSLPLRLDLTQRPLQIVDYLFGRPAQTRFQVLHRDGDRTRVRFDPITGRSHQLRVHAALGLGCPIVGDPLYMPTWLRPRDEEPGPRLMLHAITLNFLEPGTQKRLEFTAPPGF